MKERRGEDYKKESKEEKMDDEWKRATEEKEKVGAVRVCAVAVAAETSSWGSLAATHRAVAWQDAQPRFCDNTGSQDLAQCDD